jgi:hypothetical protein
MTKARYNWQENNVLARCRKELSGETCFASSGSGTAVAAPERRCGLGFRGVKAVPTDDVGAAAFDGAGKVSASYTDSTNGHISKGNQDVGTYTVNSDCTGSIVDTTTGGTWDIVILGGGKELFLIGTNKGITQTGLIKKL